MLFFYRILPANSAEEPLSERMLPSITVNGFGLAGLMGRVSQPALNRRHMTETGGVTMQAENMI